MDGATSQSDPVRDAAVRGAALFGATISDADPAPGTFLHHLRALLAAEAAGLLDREEVEGALRRFRERQAEQLEQDATQPGAGLS